MRFSVLGSGSKGNSVYIESGGTAILIDAGFSGKTIETRLLQAGVDLDKVKAVLLTHEHNDHIIGAGVMSRRCKIPVFANSGTIIGGEKKLGKLYKFEEFETGDIIDFQDFQIRSFRTSHDTNDPVGYVIEDGKRSIGYCTDTGKVTHLMAQRLCKCNAIILEFNHDPTMLKEGPYPLALQQRVRSSRGHLANEDAAQFLGQVNNTQLCTVVLAHLSETNNLPELALKAASTVELTEEQKLLIAWQNKAMPLTNV